MVPFADMYKEVSGWSTEYEKGTSGTKAAFVDNDNIAPHHKHTPHSGFIPRVNSTLLWVEYRTTLFFRTWCFLLIKEWNCFKIWDSFYWEWNFTVFELFSLFVGWRFTHFFTLLHLESTDNGNLSLAFV